MTIELTPSPDALHGLFASAFAKAAAAHGVAVSPSVEAYVVGLLVDGSRPDTFQRLWVEGPLGLRLHEALGAPPSERFERLRELGDGILYAGGFFAAHLSAHGAPSEYRHRIGAVAYASAAAALHAGGGHDGPDVLEELAARFAGLSIVLGDVGEGVRAGAARTPADILRVYERWLATGSTVLAASLGEHGVVPRRGAGGVH